MIKNNCKDCERRFVGCHSSCDDYKEYRAELEAEKKAKKEYGQIGEFMFDVSRHRKADKSSAKKGLLKKWGNK